MPVTGGHPVFAALYDRVSRAEERGWMGERRARLLAPARGRVLEIGAGTGLNLSHYGPRVSHVLLCEPDRFMRARLNRRLGSTTIPVELADAPAERLPAADASVDTVVSTLVLCSVADPHRALAEIRRVLGPDGQLLFLEHVRGEGRVAAWQDRLERPWGALAGGCHPNRDTLGAIGAAGFELPEREEFRPPVPSGGLLPHVQGRAEPHA